VVGYMIKDRLGQQIYGTNTHHLNKTLFNLQAGEEYEYRFHFPANFGVGSFSVATSLHTADTHLACNYEWRDLALVFNVVNVDKPQFVGLSWLQPQAECKKL